MLFNKEMEKLYHDPCLYEEEYEDLTADVVFWETYVKEHAISSVLELGCGSGRIGRKLIPWTKRYVGIDLSEEFLDYFRHKVTEEQMDGKVSLLRKNMTEFDLNEKFDMVFLPFNTISHLFTLEQFTDMLSCVRQHMSPEAVFMIDCFNPNVKFLQSSSELTLRNQFFSQSMQREIKVWEQSRYFSNTQINYIKRIYEDTILHTKTELDLPMKMYFPMELDGLLKLNGFCNFKKFGNYDGTPFDENSSKQIIVAHSPEYFLQSSH